MTLQQIAGYALVAAVLGGAVLFFTGYLGVDETGTVAFHQEKLEADLKTSPYDKADTYFTAQKFADALKLYEQAIAEDPENSHALRARYRIARCKHELGQEAEAKAAYKAFIKANPNHEDTPKARRYLAVLGG